MKLRCRWCHASLKPVYARLCIDCGHQVFWHAQPSQASSVKKNCSPVQQTCVCTKPSPGWGGNTPEEKAYRDGYENEQFPKKLMGYGKDAHGMFCTLNCALRWAHKYAAVVEGFSYEEVRDALHR
jgi:hypothetical protein